MGIRKVGYGAAVRATPLLLAMLVACSGGKSVDLTAWTDPPGASERTDAAKEDLLMALESQPERYVPRTHHKHADGSPIYTNRLITQSSPYLLQHAHNPVDWRPWGEEAFAAARELDRPILLSIGYSTCHWCHVMERESFEDLEIAAYINEHFVAIKVDREERPDVDGVYMEAVQAITGRGGWPLTAMLTPDKRPFFGGTYFPARDGDRGARQGFLTILRHMHDAWTTQREAVVEQASRLSQAVAQRSSVVGLPGEGEVDAEAALSLAVEHWSRNWDPRYGGLGTGTKFPRPSLGRAMLRHHARTGDADTLRRVTGMLDAMRTGGIRDHVGGGFHRYTVERSWLVPHFEKMLYDNAQLVVLYLEALQVTGEAAYADVAAETLDYVAREMTHARGGFFSATDADSPAPSGHDEEGWFFTWTPAEIEAVLGAEDAAPVIAHYGVTERGNFEGRNIFAPRGRTLDEATAAEVAAARARLYAARALRTPPGLDDKVLTAWNGLMIDAFVRGAVVLERPDYLARAVAAADFLLAEMKGPDGRLRRAWRDGKTNSDGVLEDYACLTRALLGLFEATGEARWLREAIALQGVLDARFWDDAAGGYFMTADDAEGLLVRAKPDWDGALPSGNSVAALNLLKLAELTSDDAYRARAGELFAAFGRILERNPTAVPALLTALDFARGPTRGVVIVAPASRDEAAAMLDVLRGRFVPHAAVIVTTEGGAEELAELTPLVANRPARDGKATAYVCERGVCGLPTTDPEELVRQVTAPEDGGP